jgi:hypothetical protein
LSAVVIEAGSLLKETLVPGRNYLIKTTYRGYAAPSETYLIECLSELESFLEASVDAARIHWVVIVPSASSWKGPSPLFPSVAPEQNHFWISDMSSLLILDPDFWFHECLARVARFESAHILAISESLALILECTRWRFGRLELELLCRDLVRNARGSHVLGVNHLPHWFDHPILSFIARYPSEIFG